MAKKKIVVVERGQLHGVFEQTRSSGKSGAGHVRSPWIIEGDGMAHAFEVDSVLVRNHVELIRRGKLDVTPCVREELGEFGLFGRSLHDRIGEHRENSSGNLDRTRGSP